MATALQAVHAEQVVAVSEFSMGPNGRSFGRSIIEHFEHGVARVVVDCGNWRRLDFGLLAALVKAADFSRRCGATLELVNLPSTIAADLRELRLSRRLGLVS
jgi:hypothetical protein